MKRMTHKERARLRANLRAELAAGFTAYRKVVEAGRDTRSIGWFPARKAEQMELFRRAA